MCRAGGRRCPSSTLARPSRSKEARAVRATAPIVAANLVTILPDATTTDPAYIARTGTSKVVRDAVPFEVLPAEVREPALRAAKAATSVVGENVNSLNKLTGKRLRSSAVGHIENATNYGRISPISGERALVEALQVRAEQERTKAVVASLASGENRDVLKPKELPSEALPEAAAAVAASKAKVEREQQKVWDKVVALVDKELPNATPRQRQRRFDEIGLSDPAELDGKYKALMAERKRLDAQHSRLSMTSIGIEVERQEREAKEAIDADDCYQGLRYAQAALSRNDSPSTEDLKLAKRVAEEVMKSNKQRASLLRHTLRTWLPHNVSVKSAIAAGPEAYRPETKDDDSTVFQLLTAEHGARDMALEAEVTARRLSARIAGN